MRKKLIALAVLAAPFFVSSSKALAREEIYPSGLTETQATKKVLPHIKAATDCLAQAMFSKPNFQTLYKNKLQHTLLAEAVHKCDQALQVMRDSLDESYYVGKGKEFSEGPYREDLNCALSVRFEKLIRQKPEKEDKNQPEISLDLPPKKPEATIERQAQQILLLDNRKSIDEVRYSLRENLPISINDDDWGKSTRQAFALEAMKTLAARKDIPEDVKAIGKQLYMEAFQSPRGGISKEDFDEELSRRYAEKLGTTVVAASNLIKRQSQDPESVQTLLDWGVEQTRKTDYLKKKLEQVEQEWKDLSGLEKTGAVAGNIAKQILTFGLNETLNKENIIIKNQKDAFPGLVEDQKQELSKPFALLRGAGLRGTNLEQNIRAFWLSDFETAKTGLDNIDALPLVQKREFLEALTAGAQFSANKENAISIGNIVISAGVACIILYKIALLFAAYAKKGFRRFGIESTNDLQEKFMELAQEINPKTTAFEREWQNALVNKELMPHLLALAPDIYSSPENYKNREVRQKILASAMEAFARYKQKEHDVKIKTSLSPDKFQDVEIETINRCQNEINSIFEHVGLNGSEEEVFEQLSKQEQSDKERIHGILQLKYIKIQSSLMGDLVRSGLEGEQAEKIVYRALNPLREMMEFLKRTNIPS